MSRIYWLPIALFTLVGGLAVPPTSADEALLDADSLNKQRTAAYQNNGDRILRNPRRQYLFTATNKTTSNQPLAAALWEIARRAAAASEIETAYQLAHEVLHFDPNHTAARQRLGQARQPIEKTYPIHPAKKRNSDYRWPARSYAYVTTPHFQITSRATPEQTQQLAKELETLHNVWRQLFVRYWTTPRIFQARWSAGKLPSPNGKHRVVLFANRAEYIQALESKEPQISLSTGVYRDREKTAFFYAEDPMPVATWYHEATHQLFHENGRVARNVGVQDNFWIIEGIALYMESLKVHDGFCTVGGPDAARLQFSRYRVLEEDYYQPLPDFVQFGREQLQRDPEIRRLYSQAAGLSHFLMDGRNGHYRAGLSNYLRAVYQQLDNTQTLANSTGQSLADLDREYRDFLQVSDGDVFDIHTNRGPTALSLGRTSVTDKGLGNLKDCSQLTWLNLSGCEVTDLTIGQLNVQAPLRQLSLEGTRITDLSLAKIGQFKSLEELDLSSTRITDVGMKNLAQLENLKTLWLTNTRVSNAGLQHLKHLRKLKTIETTNTRASR